MSEKKPEFKGGNVSMAKGLNLVADYAQSHGVDPAGLPGWSKTANGWNPPDFAAIAAANPQPFDLVADSELEGGYKVYAPKVRTSATDITANSTITDNGFVPAVDNWLVAEITDLDTPDIEIKMLDTWTGYPSPYEFDTTSGSPVFAAARLPLWRFFAPDPLVTALPITGEVSGEKYVSSRVLTLGFRLVETSHDGELYALSVPFFE